MPRTTQKMRVLSPVLTDAPGSREITGLSGVREDGTFVRSDETSEWFSDSSSASANKSVQQMLSDSRQKLGVQAPKEPQLPLAARLAQKPLDKFISETSGKDSFELSESATLNDEKTGRRTTTTFGDSLEEPKSGLLKRLLRRGNSQGHNKK